MMAVGEADDEVAGVRDPWLRERLRSYLVFYDRIWHRP